MKNINEYLRNGFLIVNIQTNNNYSIFLFEKIESVMQFGSFQSQSQI
jgi:hypothetical protein